MRAAIVLLTFTVVIIAVLSEDAPSLLTKDESVEGHEITTKKPARRRPTKPVGPKVTYTEYEPKDNGEYVHEIEFDDGVRHKEEGKLIGGQYHFRGFFYDKSRDPNKFHIYVKDMKGFHYYSVEIKGNGTQGYGFGEEGDEFCSSTTDSCINASLVGSLLGG